MNPIVIKEEEESEEEKNSRLEQEKLEKELHDEEVENKTKQEILEAQAINGPCPSRPEEELKQIARDLQAGHIFTSLDIPNPHDIGMVFMVIMFMDPRDFYIPDSIGMVYEYYSKAMPRGINGMPMFTSLHFLNKEDTQYVFKKAAEIHEMLKNI